MLVKNYYLYNKRQKNQGTNTIRRVKEKNRVQRRATRGKEHSRKEQSRKKSKIKKIPLIFIKNNNKLLIKYIYKSYKDKNHFYIHKFTKKKS